MVLHIKITLFLIKEFYIGKNKYFFIYANLKDLLSKK